jgi:hypothetical protein
MTLAPLRFGPLLLLAALAQAAAATTSTQGASDTTLGCGAPAELQETDGIALPATARAVQEGRLRILVIGSASVFGPGTSGPQAAWPARMEAILARRFPGLAVEVVVRGGRGLMAQETATLLAAELPALRPHLVLWQSGTVEAVRAIEPDRMRDALNEGVARTLAAGADLVLLDQQFSRFLRANTNIDVYRDAIRLVATAHGVPVLRRYELMRFWAETDRVDLERAPREMRVVVADRLNACLGGAVAALVLDGIAEAKGKVSARP